MARLTKRFVESLEANGKDTDYFDDTLPGFGVRVRRSGKRVYFVRYRERRSQRRLSIGPHGSWTTEMARKEAASLLGRVASGEELPTQYQSKARQATIADLGNRFLEEYVPFHLKPTTQIEYRRSVEYFINPALGELAITEVERNDVAEFHLSLRKTPYQANRTLGVLSVMFKQAELWGLREEFSNPCRGVKKFREIKRERFLSDDEIRRLGEALDIEELEASSAVACIRLLILTGCRLSEIQKLRWEHVDLANRRLDLPDSKTGRKTIYLGEAAVAVLNRLPALTDNPFVITGRVPGQYLTDLQKPWRRIRAFAGLDDVRIHDLRHTFASVGIANGQGLPIVGKLLGHTQAQTTARYAHLASDVALAAANRISGAIADRLDRNHARSLDAP